MKKLVEMARMICHTCIHTRQSIIVSGRKPECKEKTGEGTERMRKLSQVNSYN